MGGEDAVALAAATAHTAPQLVQLGKTEAVGVLDHHQGGIGHIHTHFNDGGGHQNVAFAPGKGAHNGILFCALHSAVEQADFQVGENGGLQGFCPQFSGFDV